MNAARRRKPPPLAEGSDGTPHYHGHRERLRQRLIEAGADSLPDYELLEVILFAANPRTDMKPLAKSLLARFGGFAELLSAEPDKLAEAGLGPAGIAALKAAREAALRAMHSELRERPVVNSWANTHLINCRPVRTRDTNTGIECVRFGRAANSKRHNRCRRSRRWSGKRSARGDCL